VEKTGSIIIRSESLLFGGVSIFLLSSVLVHAERSGSLLPLGAGRICFVCSLQDCSRNMFFFAREKLRDLMPRILQSLFCCHKSW